MFEWLNAIYSTTKYITLFLPLCQIKFEALHIIIELKYGKDSAGEAIVQIAEKEYARPIPPDYEIINIGLSVGYDKSVTSELDITSSSILLESGIEASLLSTDHTDNAETENVTVTGDHGD